MADNKAEIVLSARDEMSRVFDHVSQRFDALTGGMMGGIAAVTGTGGIALMIKSAINAADAFNDLSSKTGVSVETLSAYSHAAKLSGTSSEEVAKGLKALAKNMQAGAKEFGEYGIATRDTNGELLSVETVMGNVADRLQRMPDGAEKSALAMSLLGKSGSDLIPMLNDGSTGLEKFRLEAEQMGTVIDKDFAEKAAAFNDNLDKIMLSAKGAANAIAGFFLPALKAVSDALVIETGERKKAFEIELANLQEEGISRTEWQKNRIAFLESELVKLTQIEKVEQRRAALAGAAKLGDIRDARDRAGEVATGNPPPKTAVRTAKKLAGYSEYIDTGFEAEELKRLRDNEIQMQNEFGPSDPSRALDALGAQMAADNEAKRTAVARAGFEQRFLAETEDFIARASANQQWYDEGLLSLEEFERRKLELVLNFQARQGDAEAQAALKRQAFAKQSTEAQVSQTLGAMAKGLQYAAQTNRKAFEAQKAFSIAKASVDGVRGAIDTWNSYPYPWNIPMTLAHVAGTLGYLQQLKSSSFQGGSGATVSVPAGGGATITQPLSGSIPSSPISSTAARATEAPAPIQYNVSIIGDYVPRTVVMQVLEEMRELARLGHRVEPVLT